MLIKCLLQITCRVSSAARLNSLVTLYRLWKNLFPLFNNSYKNCDLMLQQKFDWVEGFQAPLWVKKPRWVHENQIEVEVSRFWETELLQKIELWTWQELEWPVLGSSCVCARGLWAVKTSVSGLNRCWMNRALSALWLRGTFFVVALVDAELFLYDSLSHYRKWTKIKHCWGDNGRKNHVSLSVLCLMWAWASNVGVNKVFLKSMWGRWKGGLRYGFSVIFFIFWGVYSFPISLCRFMCNFPLWETLDCGLQLCYLRSLLSFSTRLPLCVLNLGSFW